MRPRSITGPLILVIIGVLFLLNNLGHDIPFWRYLSDYWPFLLIGLGVIRLAEVFFYVSKGARLALHVPAVAEVFSGSCSFWSVWRCGVARTASTSAA